MNLKLNLTGKHNTMLFVLIAFSLSGMETPALQGDLCAVEEAMDAMEQESSPAITQNGITLCQFDGHNFEVYRKIFSKKRAHRWGKDENGEAFKQQKIS